MEPAGLRPVVLGFAGRQPLQVPELAKARFIAGRAKAGTILTQHASTLREGVDLTLVREWANLTEVESSKIPVRLCQNKGLPTMSIYERLAGKKYFYGEFDNGVEGYVRARRRRFSRSSHLMSLHGDDAPEPNRDAAAIQVLCGHFPYCAAPENTPSGGATHSNKHGFQTLLSSRISSVPTLS